MVIEAPSSPVGKLSFSLTAAFVFVLPSLGALAALVTLVLGRVGPTHLVLFFLGFLFSGLGVTVGYHRLLTHRSFEAHGAVKAVLLVLGSMAVEGRADEWVANHMKHHIHSDQEGDPHSPREGFLHAHWFWLPQFAGIDTARYAPWVLRDPVAQWVSRWFPLWVTLGYVLPLAVGGWEGLIWGGLFRQFAVQHVTMAVNSVCHRWGGRPFRTNDLSRNNPIIGLLGLGEGWHNNHHAFPSSAIHGLRWYQFDLSGYLIRVMGLLRLARDVVIVRKEQWLARWNQQPGQQASAT